MIRVDSRRKIFRYTVIITAISVAAPVCVVAGLLSMFSGVDPIIFAFAIALAALIPLIIAPAVSLVVLNMLRMVTETLDRVDAQIRFDPLTSAFNRGYFLDQIRAMQRGGLLMLIDADHFKRINDSYGHSTGDAALIILANAITKSVGDDGLTGRLGGEEFAVFLPGTCPQQGLDVANAICTNIRQLEPLVEGHRLKLTVSIGCTMHPKSALIGASLKKVDTLLYQAKEFGRDQIAHDIPIEQPNERYVLGSLQRY